MIKILIDKREPKKIFSFAKELGLNFEGKMLPVGDIVCEEKNIIFERKTQEDFHQSIINGRLQKQLIQMKSYSNSYLLISGSISKYLQQLVINNKFLRWNENYYYGSLASCNIRYGNLKVVVFDDDYGLMHFIKKIIEKTDDGKSISIYDTELLRNKVTEDDMIVKIVTNFPGLGVIRSKKLLERDTEIKEKVVNLINIMKEKGYYKQA